MNPIHYFSFWDVPRTFVFERGGTVYLVVSEFDDTLDDYPGDFEVFIVLGGGSLSALNDWKSVELLQKARIGKVPVSTVRFDESRRKQVDASLLDMLSF